MSVLDRYITREFFRMLFLGILALILVSLVVVIFERVDDIAEHQPGCWVVITFFLSRIPQDIVMITPISMLLTTLLVVGAFAKNSEIIAMLAGGISVYRIMVPILCIGLVVSLGMLGLNEFVVPVTNRINMETLRLIKGKPDRRKMAKLQIWFRGKRDSAIYDENRIYHINALIPERSDDTGKIYPPEIQQLTVFDMNEHFVPVRRLDAARAVYHKPSAQTAEHEQVGFVSDLLRRANIFAESEELEFVLKEVGTWTLYQGSQRQLDDSENTEITTFQELHDYQLPHAF